MSCACGFLMVLSGFGWEVQTVQMTEAMQLTLQHGVYVFHLLSFFSAY
jgi:hypothetical protein